MLIGRLLSSLWWRLSLRSIFLAVEIFYLLFTKNPEDLGRLVLPLTRRCLNMCDEKKAAFPKRRLKPASYPGQFALSEFPEEAWNQVR